MRLRINGSLGDEVALTAAIAAYRSCFPHEGISVEGVRYPDVFAGNPHLTDPRASEPVTTLALGTNAHGDHLVAGYLRAMGVPPAFLTVVRPRLYLSEREQEGAAELLPSRAAVAIDTWAGWPSRRWPQHRFEAVAAHVSRAGWDVIEVGRTQADCYGHERGPERLEHVAESYVDKLTIRGTAALLQRCRLYIGNDSGLAHLAAAVGTEQVVIYGRVPPTERMYGSTTAVWAVGARCAPECDERCRRTAGGCLDEVTVDMVMDAVRRQLPC